MRKYIKNNILEIFDTLHEAHEIIAKYIDNKKFDNACNLLADCQDTATQLYSIIEESEGGGFLTLSLINEYYEELFNIASSLSEKSNGCNVRNSLNKKIDKAEVSVRNDIKVKLEIVFMPYKASMWDSLESVWKAADEDPDCDAYVVPIPYFDRKPDHSFGEFHYEGDQYPDYVPVVHYNSYNLKQRRPDVIYIHNPYDGNNFVTSVHPNFYSSELKKYTDKLIYIPYFVLAEPDPNDQVTLDSISHFVLTSGVINADKVIVQSEAMRKAYINILLKYFGDTPNNRNIIEDKIDGSGSPKFDKISNSDKDTLVIPETWQRIITKPDGKQKKIILYNTSVGALLEYNEKMLEKIKSVLDVFYENKDEVALLWRPHPLIKATIESMRPQLWSEYMDIVDKYISEGWGIYDDTSDLERAVVLSDAYYGDPSSVMVLYNHLEKYIFIQNINCIIYNKKISPVVETCIRIGNDIYGAAYYFNGIIKFNMFNNKIEYLKSFEGYPLWSERLYGNIVKYGDWLVFIPLNAKNIAMYNINTNELKMYELKNPEIEVKFIGGVVCNDYIILVPYKYHSFIKFYPKTGCIEYVIYAKDVINDNKYRNNKPYFEYYLTCYNNKLYISVLGENIIVEFDINTLIYTCFEIPQINTSITGISITDNYMWITGYENATVYNVDIKNKSIHAIDIINHCYNQNLNYQCIHLKEYIVILPILEGEIKYLNIHTNEVFRFDFLDLIRDKKSISFSANWIQLQSYFEFDNDIYFWDSYNHDFYKMSITDDKMNIQKINLDISKNKFIKHNELINRITLKNNSSNLPVTENNFRGLVEYIDELKIL